MKDTKAKKIQYIACFGTIAGGYEIRTQTTVSIYGTHRTEKKLEKKNTEHTKRTRKRTNQVYENLRFFPIIIVALQRTKAV